MVYSTSTIALGAFLLQVVNVMSTPLALPPPPVESVAPDSIGSFGPGWSTSPMRGPLPIQPPSSPPTFRVGTTQLGPLFPKFMYRRMDLKARTDIASDVADLARLLNSRDVEMLDTRGFGDVLGKIFSKLGPLLLQRRELDDDMMAQLEHLLQSREIGHEIEARGLFSLIPKIISIFSKGRNAVDTVLPPPATPPSPPAPTAANAPAPQRRSDDQDIQAIERLLSRELDDYERRGFSNALNTVGSLAPLIGTIAPYIPSIVDKIKEKFSSHDQPPQASAAPVSQRRSTEDDVRELERLLGREMTDVERRGLGTKLGQAAPFAPLLFQGFDWIKDLIGNHDSPAQPAESAVPQ